MIGFMIGVAFVYGNILAFNSVDKWVMGGKDWIPSQPWWVAGWVGITLVIITFSLAFIQWALARIVLFVNR